MSIEQIIKIKRSRTVYQNIEEARASFVGKTVQDGEILSARYYDEDTNVCIYSIIGIGNNQYVPFQSSECMSMYDELSWEEYE